MSLPENFKSKITIEEAKVQLQNYMEKNHLSYADMLKDDYKEYRLNLLLAVHYWLDDKRLEACDWDEKYIFLDTFVQPTSKPTVVPDLIPDVELTDQEMDWFQRLSTDKIHAAYRIANFNKKYSLLSIQHIYCYAVNHGYAFDDKELLQLLCIMANQYITDRVKIEECFDESRMFYRTFLPDYYEKRYTPYDCLDILYCLKTETFRHIIRLSEIRCNETRWEKNRNGRLVDTIMFHAIYDYLDLHNQKNEERLRVFSENNNILSNSPLLSIYYGRKGRKGMMRTSKRYSSKVLQINKDSSGRWIYHHPMDMYMIYLGQTYRKEDKEYSKNMFEFFYHLRETLKLPRVSILDEYVEFIEKKKEHLHA